MNFKQEAAAKAITLVNENDIVGLGAGSTMAYAIEFLKRRIEDGLIVKLVTSSFTTHQLLVKENLPVLPTNLFKEIDIYFDGCDQFDKQLNALKSGGGIHTQEKLLASMAKQFVLVGDNTKLVDSFDVNYPLVIEMLPQSLSFVPFKIETLFPEVKTSIRMGDKKDGPVITQNGNYLLDVYFESWSELHHINQSIKNITGVVETSLFYGLASKAIIAGENGVIVLERN
ncbi:MAG TPA: ribose 5-phosphate isomerase A [Hanamia sp.]|nr:ribose 5-phosphate isomerase A [Hanamia sp.]